MENFIKDHQHTISLVINALEALGTIGAVIVALYLNFTKCKSKIKAVIGTRQQTKDISIRDDPCAVDNISKYITVDIKNTGLVDIVISEAFFRIKKNKYKSEDTFIQVNPQDAAHRKMASIPQTNYPVKIEPESEIVIYLTDLCSFKKELGNISFLNRFGIEFYVFTIEGKKFIVEMSSLFKKETRLREKDLVVDIIMFFNDFLIEMLELITRWQRRLRDRRRKRL